MSNPQIATHKAHKGANGDRIAARDERDLVETERDKKKCVKGKRKRRGGGKTSKGKRRGGPQGYSLCLGPENSV